MCRVELCILIISSTCIQTQLFSSAWSQFQSDMRNMILSIPSLDFTNDLSIVWVVYCLKISIIVSDPKCYIESRLLVLVKNIAL